MASGLAIGTIVSLAITILGAALMANLMLSEKLMVESIGYGAVIVILLSSSIGAWLAIGMTKRRKMVVCAGVGGLYYLCLLAITALFFGGQYQGMGVTALLVLGGSLAVGLLSLSGNRTRGKKGKKYRFR